MSTSRLGLLPRGAGGLMTSRRAADVGVSAALLGARDAGELTPVRRGVYLESERLARLSWIEMHRARALAVAEQRPGVVFAGITAAVLTGSPVVGREASDVVVLAASRSGRRRNGVVEIVRRPQAEFMRSADGATVTGLVDTLIEVSRSCPLLTALAMVDAALYVPRFGGEPYCTIGRLRAAFASMLPFPGSRRVAAVLDRATDRSETPLESLSRHRIEELGFPLPQLQFQVTRRTGAIAHLDFAWPEHAVWGEADGDGKYLGTARRRGDRRSVAEIVGAEKRREDEVRAATGWRCARWDWGQAWRTHELRDILIEAGLPRSTGRRING